MTEKIAIEISSTLVNIERDFKKVSQLAEQSTASLTKFVNRIATMGHVVAGSKVLIEYASHIRQFIDAADGLNDVATRYGVAIRAITALELAAGQSGTTLNDVGSGLAKMAVAMVEHGAALRAAGIDATNAKDAFYQFADIIKEMPSDAPETIELVRKVLGKSGDGLIPLLKMGSDGLREAEKASSDYSGAMEKLSPKADELNDAIAKLGITLKARYADALLPYMGGMTDFVKLLDAAGSSTDKMKEALDRLAKLVVGSDGGGTLLGSLSTIVGLAERLYALRGGGGNQAGRAASGRVRGSAPTDADWAAFDEQTEEYMRRRDGLARGKKLSGALGASSNGASSRGAAKKTKPLDPEGDFFAAVDEKLFEAQKKAADDAATAAEKYDEALKKSAESLYAATDAGQFDKLNESLAQAQEAFNRGFINQDQLDAINSKLIDTNEELKKSKSIGEELGMTFSSAFEDAIVSGKKLGDVLQGLGQDILRIITRKTVTEPLGNMFADFANGMFKPSANGNVFSGPGISAYSGRIVSRPTVFPFASGIGLMGEAGPEAILPLSRGSDGKLGVKSSGGGLESVRVEIINNGANQKQVESATPRFDAAGMVISVVLGDLTRNGPISQGMSSRFGLRGATA